MQMKVPLPPGSAASLLFPLCTSARDGLTREHLTAQQEPARRRINLGAPVQAAAIVPDDYIARRPVLFDDTVFGNGMAPEPIDPRLAVFQRQVRDIGPVTPAEIEAFLSGFFMYPDDGVHRTRRLARIVEGFEPGPQLAYTGMGGIMLDGEPLDPRLERVWQLVMRRALVDNEGIPAMGRPLTTMFEIAVI